MGLTPSAVRPGLPQRVSAWARVFDDGVTLFDPVTWRTHVLAPEGLALLLELLDVADGAPGCDDPAALCALLGESAKADDGAFVEGGSPAPSAPLRELAAIALHLREAAR